MPIDPRAAYDPNNVFARISLTSFFIIIIALVFGFGKFVRERVLEKNA